MTIVTQQQQQQLICKPNIIKEFFRWERFLCLKCIGIIVIQDQHLKILWKLQIFNNKFIFNISNFKGKVYDCSTNFYVNWRKERNIKSHSENFIIAYFDKVSKKFKPTSLSTKHSLCWKRRYVNTSNQKCRIRGIFKTTITHLKNMLKWTTRALYFEKTLRIHKNTPIVIFMLLI